MDDLDKQLAELQLLNNQELNLSHHAGTGKKVGPAVPPKPKKNQPQVPQSYQVKQHVEPSYSTRLQNTAPLAPSLYSNIPTPQLNQMGPKAYAKPSNYPQDPSLLYSNLQVNTPPTTKNPDGLIYSNIMHPPPTSRTQNLYSNLNMAQPQVSRNIYANGDDLPPPPPPLDLTSTTTLLGAGDYVQCTVNPANFPPPPEDLPPPPSPVSSSYSELRRATDTGYPGTDTGYPGDYQPYTMGSQVILFIGYKNTLFWTVFVC